MKKMLSLLLALSLVLSLCVPTWATEGEVVEAATAEQAQEALDKAEKGTTIQLKAGVNYGTLVLGQNASSKVVDITEIGGDTYGNERYSKFEDITILGAAGATVDQITFKTGRLDDPIWSYVDVKNLTIKDVTFTGAATAVRIPDGYVIAIDGLKIINCKMNDTDGADRFVYQPHAGYEELADKTTEEYVMTAGVKNLTITGCEVVGAHQVIEARPMENLTITDNTFKGIKARDILLGGVSGASYSGEITVTGNTSEGSMERFVRAAGIGDAAVTISGNTIRDYLGADADYIKVTDATGTCVIENNPLVYSVMIGDQGYTSLHDAIADAKGDDTITLLNDVTVDEILVIDKALTIVGAEKAEGKYSITGTGKNSSGTYKTMEVYADLTLENVEVINNQGYGRPVDMRNDGITLNVINSKITATSAGNNQLITVGGNGVGGDDVAGKTTVNISGSTLTAGRAGYGIIAFNPVEVNITKASVSTGYNALYFKGISGSLGSNGSVATVKGSTLETTNNATNPDSGNFGLFVTEDKNITLNVDAASTLKAEATGVVNQYIVMNKTGGSSEVNIANGATVTLTGDNAALNMAPVGESVILLPNTEAIKAQLVKEGYDYTEISAEQVQVYDIHNHAATLKKTEADAPTCTEDGSVAYWTCTVCGKVYADEKAETLLTDKVDPAAGHKMTKTEAKAATCTEAGNIEYYTCSVCDKFFADEKGEKELKAEDLVVKSEGHKMTKTAAKAATCTEAGNVEYYTCSVCKKTFADEAGEKELKAAELVVKAKGHDKAVEIPAVAATCTEAGKTAGAKCSVCGEVSLAQETVPAAGHKMTKTAAKAATYTEEGNIEYYTCSVCGKLFADEKGEKAITAADTVIAKLPAVEIEIPVIPEKPETPETPETPDQPETEKPEEPEVEVLPEIKVEKVEVKEEAADEVIEKAVEEAKAEEKAPVVVIDVKKEVVEAVQKQDETVKEEQIKVSTVAIPKATVEKVAKVDEEATLAVNLTTATVIMDNKALETVAEKAEGKSVELKIEHVEVEELKEEQQAAVEDKNVALTITAELICSETKKEIAKEEAGGFGGGKVTVAVAVPAKLPEGVKAADLKVYYVADDGTVKLVESELKGDQIVFDLEHFSEYVIAAEKPVVEKPASPATGDSMNIALYGALAIMSVLGMAVVLKKKAF